MIFPQLKNIDNFKKLNSHTQNNLSKVDFIFLLSLMIIDGTDNADYFIYKFNISKKDQKRLKIIDNFYANKITVKSFSEKNLDKFFYYHGKQSVVDILSYRLFTLKKVDKVLLNFISKFQSKMLPVMPISAKVLMERYDIPEGKNIGNKLKILEEEWVNNNFELTNKQINKIISR